jgi:probable HAF family extracellular repeat protein
MAITFTFTTIGVSGSVVTTATGINNGGQVVGTYQSGGVGHGFLLSGGIFTSLGFPARIALATLAHSHLGSLTLGRWWEHL